MAFGGAALKLIQTILYGLEFCCAGIILGFYSYFLSVLADRNGSINVYTKAVEGISGAGVLYTILAVLLTCCLGGKTIFALLGVILNVLFAAGFVAIAILIRDGADSCTGNVRTPLGNGPAGAKQGFDSTGEGRQITYSVSLGTACRFNTVCFAVAIIGAFLFAISAIVQLFLGRHHRKEKRFGPSPANNYTRGSGIKFWQRRRNRKTRGGLRDPEMSAGSAPINDHLAPGSRDYRPSHDTGYTGSTVAPHSATYENPHKPLVGGYHTAPTGTYNHTTPATNY